MSEIDIDMLSLLMVGDILDSDTPMLPGLLADGVAMSLAGIAESVYTFDLTILGVSLGRIEARTHGGVLTWHDLPAS